MATFLDLLIIDSWITPITHVFYQKAQIVFALLGTICNVLGVNALKPRNWFGFPGGLFFFSRTTDELYVCKMPYVQNR